MLRTSFLSLSVFLVLAGCSSDPKTPTDTTDSAVVDSGAVDTGTDSKAPPTDTGTTPLTCEEPVDGVECTAPMKATGQTVCNDAMLAELAEKCLATDISVPAACADWKAAYASCASCVAAWSWSPSEGGPAGGIYPDDYRCYWSVMDAPCAKSVNCMFECEYTACGNCLDAEERGRCYDQVGKPGGACYDKASKDGNACFDTHEMALKGCNVDEIYAASPNLATLKQQVVRYLRGACRDGANWANAENPLDGGVTDTGSETAADTSATDSATDDSAATDAADAD